MCTYRGNPFEKSVEKAGRNNLPIFVALPKCEQMPYFVLKGDGSMHYEKKLTVEKNGKKKEVVYYVKKKASEIFECDMYHVGIREGKKATEVEDFSPSEEEAVLFCNYLFDNNVSGQNIFLMGEEFILNMGI